MTERPILFSTPMVQAIMAGRKTMTRRTNGLESLIIDEKSGFVYFKKHKHQFDIHTWKQDIIKFCPYGQPGDMLWIRETFIVQNVNYKFLADNQDWKGILKFKPSIHMPKVAARIWLRITDIHVESLRDISEEDAEAEGILIDDEGLNCFDYELQTMHDITPQQSFQTLWCSINDAESWISNPWVWVVSFEVVSKTGKP